jgi:hypothetical protein
MDNKEEMVWSFSRINYSCLSDFYQNYILGREGISNGWSDYGTFLHDLMEKAAKKSISRKEAEICFDSGWDSVETPGFPRFSIDLKPHYKKKCKPFFSPDNKRWLQGDTLSVEEHLVFTLPGGAKMQGYLDRVTSEVSIRDYKISKKFTKKNKKEKARQLYLYAFGYHQVHGVYPEWLIFEFFQDWLSPERIKFKIEDMQEAIYWAEARIETLLDLIDRSDTEKGLFMPGEELKEKNGSRDFFCMNLCSYREDCPMTQGNYFKY